MANDSTPGPDLIQVVSQCHQLLAALEPPNRSKALKMLLLAFDETGDVPDDFSTRPPHQSDSHTAPGPDRFKRRAQVWLKRYDISEEMLERVLDVENDYDLVGHLPGGSKREQSISCYLLTGIQAMFRTGEAKFRDEEAVSLCKREGCYDRANHSVTRAQLGKRISGDKETAFTLTSVGLEHGAALLRSIAEA